MNKLEINNAEYIAQLEEARLSANNPYGHLFMGINRTQNMIKKTPDHQID